MSLSTTATKASHGQPRYSGHGMAYDPYYGDMLDTIQYGSVDETIQLFSRKGYDVNVEIEYVFDDGKKYSVTPLYWAVRYRKPQLCKYLLEQGARPFNNLVFEYYPLHEACSRGYADVLRVFIEAKIDLNKTTPDEDTPLHIASMRGHVECVHLLLDAGADVRICNKAGRTPVQEALYQHQDDLIQLFQVYPDPSRGSSHSKQGGTRLKRRLSLGSHRPPLRQQDSSPPTIPCRRPKSVYYDQAQLLLSTSTQFLPATTRSHSHQNLAMSPAVPPISTALPHCVGSLSAAASDHLYTTPAKISYSSYTGSVMSQPTLVSQLSIASPCAADSPSPVERDGVGRTLLTHSSTSCCSSLPVNKISSTSTTTDYAMATTDRQNTSPTKHLARTDAPSYSSTSNKQYSSSNSFTATSSSLIKEATPTVYVDSGRPHPHPRTHLPVTSSGVSLSISRSKFQHRLMGSNSNPEFPILPEVMPHVIPEKRASSYSNLYDRTIKSSVAPAEAQHISPSREKLNTLSHHVYSSFDENFNQPATSLGYLSIYSGPKSLSDRGSGTSHPVCNIVQKILLEMAQKFNMTPEHIQSLTNSIYSNDVSKVSSLPEYSGSQTKTRPHSLSDVPTSIGVEPNAENVLAELNVEVGEKPFELKFGVPAPGYMTVQYQATRKRSSPIHSGIKQTEDCHILKVIVRVFNLKNWSESSQYHSLTPVAVTTSTAGLPSNLSSSFEQLSLSRPLQEVACLQRLSSVPHPNIAPMVCHFKATTSDQHLMLARNFDPENPQAVYTAAPNSDYLLVQTSTLTLSKHFENLRKKHYGIVPETNVLATLAQLNLGIAHLVKNQIAHCSINPDNVYIDDADSNRLLVANFSQSIQFGSDLCTMEDVRSNLRLQLKSKGSSLSLCPEVIQWLQETDTDYCYIQHDTKTLFITNDSYSAARMIYSLLLGESHENIRHSDTARSQDHSNRLDSSASLPHINSLSPQCNHLLQKLMSPNISERLRPIEAAVASLVLLFGPRPSQVHSIEDCHQWLLAEAMQFYMRPVLSDSNDSDASELYSRLLYMYLTVADKAPCLVWKFCSFFKSLSVM